MMHSRKTFLLTLGLGFWLVLTPAMAQDEETQSDASTTGSLDDSEAADGSEEGAPEIIGGRTDPASLDRIERILEGGEEILSGGGYGYDRGDRRDPFLSPLKRQEINLQRGPRPEGKAGLLIDEISLTGIFETTEGTLAQVRGGPKDKSYLLEAGDQLYDGDVVAVRTNEVVFKKIINDPATPKPFREVVKRLNDEK